MKPWKIDLHLHSTWSYDAISSLSMLVEVCRHKQLDAIALTDHNELAGALQLQEIAPFNVIPGEEIMTTEGEVIGLFLTQRIPPGMTLVSTVNAIKEQQGLVYIPHPFETRRRGVSRLALEELGTHQVDIWEGFNARSRDRKAMDSFQDYAHGKRFRLAAGSDAHTPWELGRTCTRVPPFTTPRELLESLEQAELICNPIPPIVRLGFNYKIRPLLRRAVRRYMSGDLS